MYFKALSYTKQCKCCRVLYARSHIPGLHSYIKSALTVNDIEPEETCTRVGGWVGPMDPEEELTYIDVPMTEDP